MPDIRAVQSVVTLARTEKLVERNTVNVEDYLRLLLNEMRRLRLGDTSAGDADILT